MAIKLNPNERLLIEQGINHYKVVGPGRVWLAPWQRPVMQFTIRPQSQPLHFEEVRTLEHIPLNIKVRVNYQVDPTLFTPDFLPKIPGLQEQGWQNAMQWQTEYVLRQMVADYAWPDLGRQAIQERLERQLTLTLADGLQMIGLKVSGVYLVNIMLPIGLQNTLLRAEQDCIEATGRAKVLQQYFNIFGRQITQVMPHIVQWEYMNLLHKNGKSHLLLTHSNLSLAGSQSDDDPSQPTLQLQLPAL